MNTPVVLVVEDDPAIRRGLVDALTYAGYRVHECADGHEGLRAAISVDLDLALLDVVLPGMDGFQLLGEVRRAKPRLPVIMVTARGAESDRVQGLKDGADDYVVKPFSARELLARVEAVLRRSASRPEAAARLRLEDRVIDLTTRRIEFADGEQQTLSEKEVAILKYLAGRRGAPVSREELLEHVWGLDPQGIETRTVDMHIARLREKLRDRESSEPVLVTVRAKGYLLVDKAVMERG